MFTSLKGETFAVLWRQADIGHGQLARDLPHALQIGFIGLDPVPGYALKHGGEIVGRWGRLLAEAVVEESKSLNKIIHRQTSCQRDETLRIASAKHQGGGECAQL